MKRLILASASPARRRTLIAAGIDPIVIVSDVDESIVDNPDPAGLAGTLAGLKAAAVTGRLKATDRSANVSRPADLDGVGAGPAGGADGPDAAGLPVSADRPDAASLPVSADGPDAASFFVSADGDGPVDRDRGAAADLVLGCDSVLAFGGDILGKPADAAEAEQRWKAMRGRSGVLHTGHCLIEPATGRRVAETSATTVHFARISDAEIAAYVATGEPLQVAGSFTIDGVGSPFIERIEGDHGTVVGLSMPLFRRLLGQLDTTIMDLWRHPDPRP